MKWMRCTAWLRQTACGVVVVSAALCPAAAAQEATTGDPPPRIGLYVFISSQGDVEAALAPGELRQFVENSLADRLTRGGAVVFGTDALGGALRRHRVRTSMLVNEGFLADVAADPGLERVVLADLIILPSNLLLAVRHVAVPEGILRSVHVAEFDPDASDLALVAGTTADRWRDSLSQLCSDVRLETAPAATTTDTLAILPFQAHGTDEVAALAATVMLLQQVLTDSTVSVPDPSLVTTTLHAAGLDAHLLSAAGRALITARFPCRRLVHPVVVSYAASAATAGFGIPDFGDPVHESALLASGVLSVWGVDMASGNLDRVANQYFELRRETGWFGIQDKRSPVDQLEAAIDDLWSSFTASQEES